MINIVAEIGINHNGDLQTALDMIDAAKSCGANYVKFQKRNPDICVPESQKLKVRDTPWGSMTYIDYKHKIEFDFKQYKAIDEHCKKIDINWFASVWDQTSLDFMKQFNLDVVKVPSAKATDLELINNCKKLFDQVIVSTGMCTPLQIKHIVDIFDQKTDKNKLILFHTVSQYPAELSDLRMDTIDELKKYGLSVGYSSHETNIISAAATVFKGVEWIEKHFTLDKSMWGTDQLASADPIDMTELVLTVRMLEKSLGIRESVLECELDNLRKLR